MAKKWRKVAKRVGQEERREKKEEEEDRRKGKVVGKKRMKEMWEKKKSCGNAIERCQGEV